MISSIVAPASRFSNTIDTGILVLEKPRATDLAGKAFNRGTLGSIESCHIRVAIIYGYTGLMDVSIAEARNRFTQLIRAVEEGESVVITRNGKPVAQLAPPPSVRRQVRLGMMRDRIQLLPGWDDPVDLDRFLAGDL